MFWFLQLQSIVLSGFMKMLNKYGQEKRVTRGVDGLQQEVSDRSFCPLFCNDS